MTAPEPIELTAPADPATYGRPMRLGVVFWLLIGFGVLCVLGGAAIATFGPLFFPAKPAARIAPAVAAPQPASVDARLADIQARLAATPAPAVAGASGYGPQVNALADRLDRLEAGQQRLMNAASGALAAASLTQAAETSRPFAGELGALEAALPDSADVQALRPLAETGAPTLGALAAQYPDIASRAAIASRARARGEGLFARIAQALAAIVTVRRVDKLDGSGADAVLARAQRRVGDGDLAGADAELNALPPAGRDAVDPWRRAARRRIEVDRRIQAIRSAALAELSRTGAQLRPAPAAPQPSAGQAAPPQGPQP
jgi:hypothetical protein